MLTEGKRTQVDHQVNDGDDERNTEVADGEGHGVAGQFQQEKEEGYSVDSEVLEERSHCILHHLRTTLSPKS